MVKEFMDSVPDSVTVKDENGKHWVCNDDYVLNITIQDFLDVLRCSSDFYKNPTEQMMKQELNKFIKMKIEVLKENAEWYINLAMPEFMKGEFKNGPGKK